MNNRYVDRDKEHPITLVKTNRRIEYFKPMKMRRPQRSGIQYGQDSKMKPKPFKPKEDEDVDSS